MNGWDRVPDTLAARCRVEDYLRRPLRPAPYCRVLRVARQIENCIGDDPQPYWFGVRRTLDWQYDWDDVWNEAVRLVHRRRNERASAPVPPSWERFTHELTADGVREIA